MARDRWFPEVDGEGDAESPVVTCWLCGRDMGEVAEWHHPIPKSRGGKLKVPVHPICHESIHSNFTNAELGRMGADLDALKRHPAVTKFLDWVANKPPDFHAPTHMDGGRGGRRR